MFFAGKEKKSSGSKVLTEAEIKKKLYGDYDTVVSEIHSHAFEVRPAVKNVIVKNEATQHSNFSSSVAPVRSASFGAASKPDVLVSRPPTFSSETPARKNPFQGSSSAPQRATSDWKKVVIEAGGAVLGLLAGVLWKVGSYFIQVLDFVLRILDPRKPQARKILYSVAACILVAALFFGVFRLNAQRKKAMMGELKLDSTAVIAPNSKPVLLAPIKVTTTKLASAPGTAVIEQVQTQKDESQETILTALENSNTTRSSEKSVEEMTGASAAASARYVIQVATYAVFEDANRIIQTLAQAGFTAFTKKQIRNSTGHAFYPVYLGRFESSSLAQQTLAKFRRANVARPFQDSFIRTLE